MVGIFNYHWSKIWLLPGTNKTMACGYEQLRYFLEPRLRSPMKGTDTLTGQLVQRDLKMPKWKKKLQNGLTNLKF